MTEVAATRFCECAEGRVFVSRTWNLLDHTPPCEFPDGICSVREHRQVLHPDCGLPVRVAFCGCGVMAGTLDPERGWWVCPHCGWPKRLWFEAVGTPAPDHLVGLRPVTFHDYEPVTGPKKRLAQLFDGDEERIALNVRLAGRPVRD